MKTKKINENSSMLDVLGNAMTYRLYVLHTNQNYCGIEIRRELKMSFLEGLCIEEVKDLSYFGVTKINKLIYACKEAGVNFYK